MSQCAAVRKNVRKGNERRVKLVSGNGAMHCSCCRNGYCSIREGACNPNSLKCIKNKKSFNNALAPIAPQEKDTVRVARRNRSSYNPLEERYGSNKNVEVLGKNKKPVALWVFKGFLNLNKKYTTDYYLFLNDVKKERNIRILVAYNSRTDRYYISDTQLKWLYKNKFYPDIVFNASNDGSIPMVTAEFQEMSVLALYGYSVGRNGLKAEERQDILEYVLDNRILSGYQIINHLQGLISLREDRQDADFTYAISCWREDIRFVNNYRRH